MQLNSSSPFSQPDLIPITQEYSRKAKLMAIKLPDGNIIIDYNHSTKKSVLQDMARVMGAEFVLVSGTWTFTPDRES
jgi:hypothetical protein